MKNKILLLMAVATLGLTTATIAQVPSYVPTNGLVGYWPFNGNANDESGNGNNGTVNGATLTSDRNGNANSAYSFDGVNDYIEGIFVNFPLGNNARTISSWVLFPQNNTNYTNFICSWGLGTASLSSANQGFGFYAPFGFYPNSPNTMAIWQSFGNSQQNEIYNNANFSQNIFIHLAVTIEQNGNFIFYINGLPVYNNIIIGMNTVPNGNIFRIGRSTHTNTSEWAGYFLGKLDNIGIWNRALSQQEITDLYSGCQLSVSTQPVSQNIYFNSNAQFIVGSSDTNATYQWQTDLGLGFQNLSNAGQYSGTTNDTLSVANVAMNNDNQQFRCIISNGICADTSNVAVLSVNNCQLSVSTQPANQTININNNAQFVVGSSDTNATYQWQTDLGLGFQNVSNAGQYNGATNDTLSVANVSMSNNNQLFRCIINSGSCADTSNVAVLTINNNLGINITAQHNLFSVFPNPAHNIISVKADHKLIGSAFTIYDNTGKAVQSGKINAANTTIELSNLSGGVYLFSVGEKIKQTFKIIKE